NGREEWLRWEIHPWHKGNGEIGGIIMFTEVITERKRASELFKRQFENSPDIILIINKKFEIESINRGIPEGPPARDLIGLNAIELLPAESREAAGNAIMTCFATGQNQEIEGMLRFGNWARSRFVPVIYHEGVITHIMIISTDITERKKTAEKIIRSEARLKEAQAIAHIGNWEIDMVNNVQRWSGGLYKILGTNKEETQASTDMLLSFIHDDDSGSAREQIREAFTTLRDAAVNFRLVQKNGSIKYARIEWKFEFDAHAHPIRLYGIVQDITERRKAEESIKQSEANYRKMFNLSPVPMLLIDEETNGIVQVNQACVAHYGYSEAAFRGMTIDQINPQNDGKPEKNTSTKKNMLNNDFMGAGRHIKKSGEIMEVISSSIPVILNGKKHLLLVATDVTEKNLYEQKLTRAAIKAQEEEKYEIGGELHDNVCQILATSLITLGMMKKKLPGESRAYFDQTREYISLASKELRNLSHRLAPAFIDNATLEDAFDSLLKNFNVNNKYDITLDFNHHAKGYPLSRELQLNLYRVLQEQLGNIAKYANATAIEVAVSITDHKLQMRITDNGIGFDADSIKGGIGLANMNRRVRLFSGSFRIDAAVGNGCTIMVVIPLSNAN
ncbi:MAG: PAS domain S-box protein, partial [Bacteroidota bacterium]